MAEEIEVEFNDGRKLRLVPDVSVDAGVGWINSDGSVSAHPTTIRSAQETRSPSVILNDDAQDPEDG